MSPSFSFTLGGLSSVSVLYQRPACTIPWRERPGLFPETPNPGWAPPRAPRGQPQHGLGVSGKSPGPWPPQALGAPLTSSGLSTYRPCKVPPWYLYSDFAP